MQKTSSKFINKTADPQRCPTEKKEPVKRYIKSFKISNLVNYLWKTTTVAAAFTLIAALTGATMSSSSMAATALISAATTLGVVFAVEAVNYARPHLPPQAALITHHIYAHVQDFFVLFGIIAMAPATFFSLDPKCKAPVSQTPILLVHGYLHSQSGWLYHRHRLRAADFGPVFTINLGSPFNSIEDYSRKVQKKAREIAELTGRSDLILIGHSMGGLVSTYYAMNDAPPNTVTDVITLGSPLQGTKLAPLGVGKCVIQMKYQCEFINSLKAKVDGCKTIRFLNFGSYVDRLIIPQNSALMGHQNAKTHVIPDMGHMRYLLSDKVSDRIIEHLRNLPGN